MTAAPAASHAKDPESPEHPQQDTPMCHDELSLEQLLADPLTRLLMLSDSVEERDIRQLAAHLGAHRTSRQRHPLTNLPTPPA